jgi:hypothetical protein
MLLTSMGTIIRHPRGRRRMLPTTFLTFALGAALVVAAFGATALASKLITLGATKTTPAPSCPRDPCQAVGKVTGFQAAAAGRSGLFRAPSDGKVIKWSIGLSKPNDKQTKFFTDFYGGPPRARIAVLRRANTASPPRYKLMRRGPVEELTPYLGQGGQTFVLNSPLGAKKNDVIALTLPTWAPSFAVGISSRNVWRASRSPKKCTKVADIKSGAAQSGVNSIRTYGCVYSGARLIYTAGFAPK